MLPLNASTPISRPQVDTGATPLRATLIAITAAALFSGCTVLQEDKIDYKSAQRGSTLEVPPDLTQLNRDNRFNVPGATVTASGFEAGQPAQPGGSTAASTVGDVRIERAGSQRWLVVDRPANALWEPVRSFWQENGFVLELDQEALGIMETDWAENRAKLPQDFIRRTLGRVLDSFYSTAERDRFRTRLERTPSGGTEIYISHRGMIEVYTNTQKEDTRWQPRPADVELETEFLRRLMVRLGVSEAQSQAVTATAPVVAAARVTTANNVPVMQFEDGFDRGWRRVGLALDRTGFTVEDRNRSQGIYFVRYVEPRADKGQPGLISRVFGASRAENAPVRYRVSVVSADNITTVTVLSSEGKPDSSANAQRILTLLADDLK
ncbi:outer membrane protein assembly factor BamC [Hydrogenophaga palleronii]|uniref:Outer membrane protein assembly factor BamC n=1 Tax=Hydrogenophaga palleronii TaxID=65655 RepID=A0ABU1WJF4_9BURK|nr:outer membrane protein assembly factor BamC [Hydrogenophaga palleronii]MDR7149197.1 outer membrane protein assembly factor BamC [Hydrogenophaga palleronii]